jgi:hypothetical protein
MASNQGQEGGPHRGGASGSEETSEKRTVNADKTVSNSSTEINESAPNRSLRNIATARHQLRRFGIPVLGFLIASLLLPALTKQWSDRSGELDLKNDLLTSVNQTTTDAVLASDCLNQFCLPELAPFRSLAEDTTVEDLDPELWNNALISASKFRIDFTREWQKSQAVTQGVFDSCFPSTVAHERWAEYAAAVDAYLEVRTQNCGETESTEISNLRRYLGTAGQGSWADISSCDTNLRDTAYTRIGEDLLHARERVTTAVIESNAAGYSSGFADLLRDLWPF